MDLYLGVDGGGSHTRVAVTDGAGRVLGRAEAGTGNLHHASESEVEANLGAAIAAGLAPTGEPVSSVVSAFFGMAGVTSEITQARFRRLARRLGLEAARVGVDHDIRIALAGGLAGRPGIALIVGTGSSCYGRTADGRTWQTGGWGMLVADEGSGYDLGRQAVVAAVRMADGRLPATMLRERVFEWLGVGSVSEVLVRLYEQGMERSEMATFAPKLIGLAEGGDGAARAILESGAAQLAALVEANHRCLATAARPEVVTTGGLGTAPTLYRDLIRAAIGERLPVATVREPELDPVLGAALLALEQAGIPGGPAVVLQLQNSEL